MDAGGALNHLHILDHLLKSVESLLVATLSPESEECFPFRRVSYVWDDLRALPLRDNWFDIVISISTLEHVGMDNYLYIQEGHSSSADPDHEVLKAVQELKRVLKPSGTALITVPFGVREDHGWFRQYNQQDVERLIDAFSPSHHKLSIFKYSLSGWQISDRDAAADATYKDFQKDKSPANDRAAAARAIACIKMTK